MSVIAASVRNITKVWLTVGLVVASCDSRVTKGDIVTPQPACDPGTTRVCSSNIGACVPGEETCRDDGTWGPCDGVLPSAEACNNADDNCNGTDDDGCDDDGDGWCDASMMVVGAPGICPHSVAGPGDDCADASATTHPGAPELCGDGFDNDCNGLLDGQEPLACPAVSVDILASGDPLLIAHGRSETLRAVLTPADSGMVWTRTWTVVDAQPAASCSAGDLTFAAALDDTTSSEIDVTAPDAASTMGCIYSVQIEIAGSARDTVRVQATNQAPWLTMIAPAVFDGARWRLTAAAGSTPSLAAYTFDPDGDTPVTHDWSGGGESELDCAATSCVFATSAPPMRSTVTWAAPATPGDYTLTLSLTDSTGASTTAEIVVEVANCVWAAEGGGGSGTLADPLGSLQQALAQAAASPGAAVCVIDGTFGEDLLFPSSPRSPSLFGGFSATGARSNAAALVQATGNEGARFAAGYDGTVARVVFAQSAAFTGAAARAALVTITGASPVLSDVTVELGRGNPVIGIAIADDASTGSPARPRFAATHVSVSSLLPPNAAATAIEVSRRAAAEIAPSFTGDVYLTCATGPCRAVHVRSGAQVTITGSSLYATLLGAGMSIGVDVDGTALAPASAIITGNSVRASGGDDALGIRLHYAADTRIVSNDSISGGTSGSGLSAGIADGTLAADGTATPGGSANVTIEGNTSIDGYSFAAASVCEASVASVGMLLVGSSDFDVVGNGRPSGSWKGIRGGGARLSWDPAARRLPPSPVGVWLVDTSGVHLQDNEIRGGYFENPAGCPPPSWEPESVALRDGLPPNPSFGTGASGGSASRDLVIAGNGTTCSLNIEMQTGMISWCTGVELNAPGSDALGDAPLVVNNMLAATRGDHLVGFRQRGGSGTIVVNNTVDVDLIFAASETPSSGSVRKWAVLLEDLDSGGIELVNNIFNVRRHDLYDAERLCLREVGTSQSNVGRLLNNLFFIEGDNLGLPAAPYVRLVGPSMTRNYASDSLNNVAGVGTATANFAAAPGLTEIRSEWSKSTARLLTGSAAIDSGLADAVTPALDADREARPAGAGVDIGHDERP